MSRLLISPVYQDAIKARKKVKAELILTLRIRKFIADSAFYVYYKPDKPYVLPRCQFQSSRREIGRFLALYCVTKSG